MTISRMISLGCVLSLMTDAGYASVRNEIATLYNQGGITTFSEFPSNKVSVNTGSPPRWFSLMNGQRADLNDWKVVLFMQGSCVFCQRFDPMLKRLAEKTGFTVFAYTIDGQGDVTFPTALPAPAEVMKDFFPPSIPVATPTTFLVNVATLQAWPLLQGVTDEAGFLSRLDSVLQEAIRKRDHG